MSNLQRSQFARHRVVKAGRLCLLVSVATVVGASELATQEVTLGVGTRVRVNAPTLFQQQITGEVAAVEEAALEMRIDAGTTAVSVPFSAIERLQISRGDHSNSGKGALIGLGVGAGLGLALGIAAAAADDGNGSYWDWDVGAGEVLAVTAVFGAAGAGVGALIGLASRTESWQTIPTDGVRPTVTPQPGGVTLGMSLRL